MSLALHTIPMTPFLDQKPGTSGLRKQVAVFAQPHYLAGYLAALLGVIRPEAGFGGHTLIVGGDGRYWNDVAIQTVIRFAVAQGFARVLVAHQGILSTPAASHLIRMHGALAGIVLSASHNAGGVDGDFGVKLNLANGGPAPESVTEAIYQASQTIHEYTLSDTASIDLTQLGATTLGATVVEVIDTIRDYVDLMRALFDFEAIRGLFAAGFRLRFDAMHAVTGPYAHAIFEEALQAGAGTVMRGTPLPDFGGGHPDPNATHAHALYALMMADDAPDMGAASDGDGDRNWVLGARTPVSPSDALAILTANAHCAPAYRQGLLGVARSMPTSQAVDRVAAALNIPCYETPTGWKFFGNLLDAGKITLCGEESAAASSNHVREKDGIWAVLLWLNILAVRQCSIAELLRQHWQIYGQNYYTRHDFEAIDMDAAQAVMAHLRALTPTAVGQAIAGASVVLADDFTYDDSVDGSRTTGQGVRLLMDNGARIVYRLSGTGTVGATLRVYIEAYTSEVAQQGRDTQSVLHPWINASREWARITELTGRAQPCVIT